METVSGEQQVELQVKGSTAFLFLGPADQKIPVLTRARMDSLAGKIKELKSNEQVKAVVIAGAASSGFCAGADVEAIRGVVNPDEGERLAKEGQALFSEIAGLKATTVAAIHGPCVGGGCELALACDYRLLLDSEATKIGLPEIKLGILPGFGGTQRLPRLIGLPKALQIILNGRVVSASQAARMGLASELVPAAAEDPAKNFENLLAQAESVALGKRHLPRYVPPLSERLLGNNPLGRMIVRSKAEAGVRKETKGHYPAPLRALQITVDGMAASLEEALAAEAKALGELIVTPESKALVHIYFCTEAASKLGRSAKDEVDSFRMGVMGAGVMGSGIAASFLQKGYRVRILDPDEKARERSRGHLAETLQKRRSLSEARRKELMEDHLLYTPKMDDLARSDILIEAIVEDLEVKRDVLRSAAELLDQKAIIASNTSSLSIGDIAEKIPNPERVIGMHFFNPAEKMPLVEVVRGPSTSNGTLARVAALASKIGKFPVVVEDVPGFLVNRILSPYIAEAGLLLEEGYRLTDIDAAAVNFGMPMGPFRMLDEVGLDVAAKVQEVMTASYGARVQAPAFPKKLTDHKRFGRKSQHGFYRYEGKEAIPDHSTYELLELQRETKNADRELLQDRLVFALVQEATRCLDEGVAGAPGPDSAAQIDLATVMGMGFAPFRGGVIYYAEQLGAETVEKRLQELAEVAGERFLPVNGISKRAASKKSFFSVAD